MGILILLVIDLTSISMKLAIANVATQDSYNRKGNLFHCDLDNGISKKLEGHTRFDQRFNQGTRLILGVP